MMPYTWMSIRVVARFHDFVSTSYSFPSCVPAQMYLPSRVSECLPAACATHLAVTEIASAETSPRGPFVKTWIKLPSELLNLALFEALTFELVRAGTPRVNLMARWNSKEVPNYVYLRHFIIAMHCFSF